VSFKYFSNFNYFHAELKPFPPSSGGEGAKKQTLAIHRITIKLSIEFRCFSNVYKYEE